MRRVLFVVCVLLARHAAPVVAAASPDQTLAISTFRLDLTMESSASGSGSWESVDSTIQSAAKKHLAYIYVLELDSTPTQVLLTVVSDEDDKDEDEDEDGSSGIIVRQSFVGGVVGLPADGPPLPSRSDLDEITLRAFDIPGYGEYFLKELRDADDPGLDGLLLVVASKVDAPVPSAPTLPPGSDGTGPDLASTLQGGDVVVIGGMPVNVWAIAAVTALGAIILIIVLCTPIHKKDLRVIKPNPSGEAEGLEEASFPSTSWGSTQPSSLPPAEDGGGSGGGNGNGRPPISIVVVTTKRYLELHNEEWIPIIGEQDIDEEALGEGQFTRLMVVIRRAYREAHPVVQSVVGVGSCFFTYGIMHTLDGFTSSIASYSVILIVGTSSPHLTVPAGLSAFAINDNTPLAWLTLLGVITSAVLLIAERYKFLVGYPGRGGILVFIANNITMIIMMASGSISWNLYGDRGHLWKEVLTWEPSMALVLGSVVTSGICGVYRIQSHVPLNPLLSLSAVALFLILLITATQYQYADEWSSGVCTGAFVAMGSMNNLPTLRAFVLLGFLGGLYKLFWSPFFTGFSGDISAFCGYVTYHWIVRFVNQLTSQTPYIRNEGCKPPGVIWIDKSQVMI